MTVQGLTFENVTIDAHQPGFSLRNIRELELHHVAPRKPNPQQPFVRLRAVKEAAIQFCTAARNTGTFLELSGPENEDVTLGVNRLRRAGKNISYTDGATEAALAPSVSS